MWPVSLNPSPESGFSPADVVIDASSTATVGDLAAALGRHLSGGHAGTLVAPVEDGEPWPAKRPLAECGLRAGAVLDVVTVPQSWTDRPPRPSKRRAVVRVVAGPDAGASHVLTGESATIGRGGCTVPLTDPLVSRRHASLLLGPTPMLTDEGSAHGTSVDGTLITRPTAVEWGRPIRLGDSAIVVEPAEDTDATSTGVLRPPRFGEPLAEGTVELPAPPNPPRPQPLQWAMFAMPLVLGGAMLLTTHSTYSLAYMVAYPMIMVATYFGQRRRSRKEHAEALRLWRADVDAALTGLDAAAAAQRVRAGEDHPQLATLTTRVQLHSPALWQRRAGDADYLAVRAGAGPVPALLTATLREGGDRGPAATAREDIGRRKVLDALAVPVRFADAPLLAIAGPRERVDGVARALLARLACDHSPADLTFAAVLGRDRAPHEAWLRWLPHTARRPGGAPPIAIGAAEGTALLDTLLAEGAGATVCLVDESAGLPRRLVEAAAAGEAARDGRLRLLWLGADPHTVPSATTVLVDLTASVPAANAQRAATRPDRPEPHAVALLAHRDRAGVQLLTEVDELSLGEAWRLARGLVGCTDEAAVIPADTALPDVVRLPDLVPDLTDPDDVAGIRARWASRRGLRAQIGMGAGTVISLDLREDGPHGLVAGTTGSGKSELLQSLICSLALNNPPARITFLLVDYKGGAAFRECADLPHTVGYLTDLTPALVQRALTSLGAEVSSRERLLEEYAAKDLVDLERRFPDVAPPSLLICVDEFAALTADVPEFVDGVVNIAQRGRSLGMHLLLATQRPAGVVTGNVRANTDLRIALRVASTDDSTDVIDSPDAARISRRTPGRAWIRRTGHGTAELVQAAWVGAHAPVAGRERAVEVRPFTAARASAPAPASDLDPRTDLDRLVRAIRRAFTESGAPAPKRPWLPALPAEVALDCERGASGELAVGVLDRPAEQAQTPAVLDFARAGHVLVYGASGSGKTELLRTVAVTAALTEPVPPSVYGIDFGGGALGMLAALPVVGAVVGEAELSRVMRLIRMLRAAVADRNRLLAGRGAADLAALAEAGVDVPRVYVLIDNLPALIETLESGGAARRAHAEALLAVLQDGRRAGVHVTATAPRRTGIPSGLASAFGQRIVLRMPADDDYGMLGVPGGVLDADTPPGRALLGRHEVQIATTGGAGTPAQAERLAEIAAQLGDLPRAVGVPAMPARLPQTAMPQPQRDAVPFAVEADFVSAVSAPLARTPLLVAGRAGTGRTSFLTGLAALARRSTEPPADVVLIGPRARPAEGVDTVITDPAAVLDWLPGYRDKIARDPDAWHLVLVDDAHVWERGYDSPGPARDAVTALAELATQAGVAYVVASDSDDARTRQHVPGSVQVARRGRFGVLLAPDLADGSLFGQTLPMNTAEPLVGAGRGVLCEGGTLRVVQVISTAATEGGT